MKPSIKRLISNLPPDFDPYSKEQREKELEIYRKKLEAARSEERGPLFDTYLNGVLLELNALGRHEEVLEFMPDIPGISMNMYQKALMAKSMLALGQTMEAIAFLEHWTADDPDNRELQIVLADAYIAAGRFSEANKTRQRIEEMKLSTAARSAKTYEDFIREDPTDPEDHCYLAETRAELGDFEGAVKAIEAAIELDPEDQDYREMLEEYKGKMRGGRN